MALDTRPNLGPSPVPIAWPSDLAALHRLNPRRYPCLLESLADNSTIGRYDLLFACPQATLQLNSDFTLSGPVSGENGRFLDAFDQWWNEAPVSVQAGGGMPFSGGWFMMLGYELAQQIEPTLNLRPEPDVPVAMAIRIPTAIIRDRCKKRAWIVVETGFDEQAGQIMHDLDLLQETPPATSAPEATASILEENLTEENPERFIDAVRRAQQYIVAGDVFQANLSRQWHGRLRPGLQPVDIYERLRASNPAPFAGLAVFDDYAVISSSPERLMKIGNNRAETRPIAGTRPRSSDERNAAPLRSELLENPKERAEHVMVIDLERNDLGRICRPGSVEVDEFMVIESYAHVHHIVSNITGQLSAGTTPGDVIAAMFPGGSITGCPKVRCMEIINELEGRPRGAYTGAMGYINRDGSGDLSILIRCITANGRELSFSTGSGIVTDSDPDQELDETRAKAKGLILALAGAGEPVSID